jgi:hypothetical protein
MRCSGGVRARHRKQLVEGRSGLWSGGEERTDESGEKGSRRTEKEDERQRR